MVLVLTDKEYTLKKCFALFPKRIGNYLVWLSTYYKTWDYSNQGIYTGYIPHLFVYKEDAENYIKEKG